MYFSKCGTFNPRLSHCSKKSRDGGKQNNLMINPPINAVPFSDEWLAAMEAAGEVVIYLCKVHQAEI